jgi:periplasmic divalent cation tolerance protein
MKLVLSTCSEADASEIGRLIVEERLAACCNRLPGVESTYWWEGRLTTDLETLMIFKVADDRLEAMMARLKAIHPYELPEILVLPIETGLEAYLAWVNREGRPQPKGASGA